MTRVRISDVAHEAGVSLGTVSNAINHPNRVRPDKLKLIHETIDRLGYVPNQAARQLAGGKSRVLGLVLPGLDHIASVQIANGAQAESRALGYDLLIAIFNNDESLARDYLRSFLGVHVAGILMQPMDTSDWKPLSEVSSTPTVYLDMPCSESNAPLAADQKTHGYLTANPGFEIGRKGVQLLIARIEGRKMASAPAEPKKATVIDTHDAG